MPNSGFPIPSDLNELISEREKLNGELSKSEHQIAELENLLSQIPRDTPIEPLAALTSQNLPPDELNAALPQLVKELTKLKKLEGDVQGNRIEIERIKENARGFARTVIVSLIIGAILMGIVIIIILRNNGMLFAR